MSIVREIPKCPYCKEPNAKAIYHDEKTTSIVGDLFIGWEATPCKCSGGGWKFLDVESALDKGIPEYKEFKKGVEALVNRNSMENGSDTPDFIIADYLTDTLKNWDEAMKKRIKWFEESRREEGPARSLGELLSKFENGKERYHESPVFNQNIQALLRGMDPLKLIDQLVAMIDEKHWKG